MSQKNNFIFLSLLILISFGIILWLVLILKPKTQLVQNQPPTPAISQPTQEPQQKSEEIDTSNWKTYRNEKYGFEVKYPKDYDKVEECKLKETDNGIEIGEGRLRIEVEVLKYEHPLENYVQKFVAEKMKEYGILGRSLDELSEENLWIPMEKILVGSNEGFRVSLPVKPSNIIFLSNGNKFYKIIWTSIGVTSCLGYNGIEGYDEFQIFEQIPFTFRIIK
jgi:ABC-type glycerol-3-phosphate transport system permease component